MEGCLDYMKATVDTLTDPSPRYGSTHGWHANQTASIQPLNTGRADRKTTTST
jgi:hypothetical protein